MLALKFATRLKRPQKRLIFMVLDTLIVPFSLGVALLVLGAGALAQASQVSLVLLVATLMVAAALSSNFLGLTRIKLNSYEMQGILRTAKFAVSLGVMAFVLNLGVGALNGYAVFIVFTMVLMLSTVAMRMILRQLLIRAYQTGGSRTRILVYGASQTGQQLAMALQSDESLELVAFIEENPTLQNLTIAGLPVYSPLKLADLVRSENIDRIVLCLPSASQTEQARLAYKLRSLGCEVHSLPSFATLLSKGTIGSKSTPVVINELLGRGHLSHELPRVAESYSGRHVMITGAGGSIGSELCRQIASCSPKSIILIDHSELALYTIHKELSETPAEFKIVPILGSVTDKRLIEHTLRAHDVDVILHAAAYKHLPLVEENAIAGLANNVLGTKIVAEAARAAGVRRFTLISTDKAVRPVNVMGASKRLAELVVQDLASRSTNTRFSMVRFGNVLGSSGSVIPLFKEQIARGGPLTLTHNEVTRYFMTISEAARLVLLAASYARGGDVFVLDMGKPVPIAKLARQMIEASGYSVKDKENPHGDIEIEVTGLRPGEKMHEELLISSDMLTTPHPKILRVQESALSEIEVANALRDIRSAVEQYDESIARSIVTRWITKDTAQAEKAAAPLSS
ncbi:polysaccharide biosynthesis protein [Lentibacter sp. XHP0401]|jgi:FlaA1/EpsC-like NDP-sugar epimerase|uniref:polysaccharide biosynthesis protein n=1 Tax=Lentibacter sp. XHP0401 TaxID=2984334 RepID=UPI0021E95BE7|nr:nucleoside-diphosphate sugar epimerase/dehydratase [Lentibacter sp. XHP0401]MCV2894844.1 polysaccharide biosynthesis protein [Lentibacter sp. XHP0401]